MLDTMTRYLTGFSEVKHRIALRFIAEPIVDRFSSQPLNTAGLAITGGGGTAAKIGASDFYAVANGILVKIAASTTLPALVGTITAASFNVFCFFVDSAAVATVAMGTEGTTLAKVKFPTFPKNKTLVGFLIVTYASTFTGGTTALDTATTVYVNGAGPFDPSVLI